MNCLINLLTSCIELPLPRAILFLLLPFKIFGVVLSFFVIDCIIASTFVICFAFYGVYSDEIAEACIAVVTVPDPHSSAQIIRSIHLLSPNLPVIARSRYQIAIPDLQKAGAVVVDEEHAVGMALAREVIEILRQPQTQAMPCALANRKTAKEK